MRLDDGTGFAKLRPVALGAPTDAHPGPVTLEYAVQPAADQPFGPVQTVTLDGSTPTALDLAGGASGPAVDGWDLPRDLEGMPMVYTEEGLLPHEGMARWVASRVRGAVRPPVVGRGG